MKVAFQNFLIWHSHRLSKFMVENNSSWIWWYGLKHRNW